MRRMAVAGLLLVLAGTGTAGCTSSSTSSASSGTSSSSGLCDSVAALKQSASKLKDMQLGENGVAAMRDQLSVVGADLTHVIDEARAQYADAASGLQKDVDALKSAAAAAKDNPSTDALGAVRAPLDTLVADVTTLSERVLSGCP